MSEHFFTDTWVMERTGKHRTTVYRWRQDGRFPPELERLAELELEGQLALIHDKWQGWKIDPRTGELVTPGGDRFMPAELVALPVQYQRLTELTRLANNVRGTERDPSRPIRATLLRLVRRWLRVKRRP